MNEKLFVDSLKEFGISVNDNQLNQLNLYYDMLVDWNQRMNLTSIIKKEDVYLKHFYDSASICKVVSLENEETLCDIGTGAGFPGMVLKILFPNLKVTLVDSLGKRIHFLQAVVQKLKLEQVFIVESRAEEYALNVREYFDVVTARAVAPLDILLEYSTPLVKIGKYFIPLKADISKESVKISNVCNKMNCTLIQTESFFLPIENSLRTLLKFQKNKTTNPNYPRRYAEMKKHPLCDI